MVEHTWAMSPQAELDSYEGADDELPETAAAEHDSEGDELAGLHAKLFVMDDGWHARIWTGSANATEAAFQRNVERGGPHPLDRFSSQLRWNPGS